MNANILDIYTDYLICQNKHATATGLSDMLSGDVSHDKITRFLSSGDLGSKELWEYVKPTLRSHQQSDGVLILDDFIEEKPYTDENDVVCWHYSHSKGHTLKGINVLSCMVAYDKVSLPIGYETIKKELQYCDIETKKLRRKSSITKNQLFRKLIKQACDNQVLFKHVLADNWFGSKENMEYIHNDLKKIFIFGIKSNRKLALSKEDAIRGKFQPAKSLELKEDIAQQVWMKGLSFPVQVLKKIFKNEDGSTGILYLVSNDMQVDAESLYKIYQKRWKIEEYHKSIKQNASLAKSPTKTIRTQCNHIFASIIAYCKLELLSLKTHLNHFAIKYKLIVRANQIALNELNNIRDTVA